MLFGSFCQAESSGGAPKRSRECTTVFISAIGQESWIFIRPMRTRLAKAVMKLYLQYAGKTRRDCSRTFSHCSARRYAGEKIFTQFFPNCIETENSDAEI